MLVWLKMDERGALSIGLAGGQEIRFGRRALDDRLDRFFNVAAPVLANGLGRVSYVDLRYPNGFAVGWRDEPPFIEAQLTEMDISG